MGKEAMREQVHVNGDVVTIDRSIRGGPHLFSQVFEGFEKAPPVRGLFGEKTERTLAEVYVHILPEVRGIMRVRQEDSHILIHQPYLETGNPRFLYLDAVHELVHIRQYQEGLDLYDARYVYVDRPTEVEAYRYVVAEARRIGLADAEIQRYLRVPWVTDEEFQRLLTKMCVGEAPTVDG